MDWASLFERAPGSSVAAVREALGERRDAGRGEEHDE